MCIYDNDAYFRLCSRQSSLLHAQFRESSNFTAGDSLEIYLYFCDWTVLYQCKVGRDFPCDSLVDGAAPVRKKPKSYNEIRIIVWMSSNIFYCTLVQLCCCMQPSAATTINKSRCLVAGGCQCDLQCWLLLLLIATTVLLSTCLRTTTAAQCNLPIRVLCLWFDCPLPYSFTYCAVSRCLFLAAVACWPLVVTLYMSSSCLPPSLLVWVPSARLSFPISAISCYSLLQ